MTNTELLRIIDTNAAIPNARNLEFLRWEIRFNLAVSKALADGLIRPNPRRRSAYELTPSGKAMLNK